jgi:histidine triad (HIT) family protein
MGQGNDCVFCQIVCGEMPSFRVHEDESTLTFLDLFPVTEGHTLVVTKQHFPNVFEASEPALTAVAATSLKVARAIRKALEPDGLAVAQLNGEAAGQTVFHYHMHLIPRTAGEPFRLHGRRRGDPERLRQVAGAIAHALAES